MVSGKNKGAQKIPIRFTSEEDASALDVAAATDTTADTAAAQAATPEPPPSIESELSPAAPIVTAENAAPPEVEHSGEEVIDGDNAPSLSEILKELEAQDQAEAEAQARARAAEEASAVSRGERATAALAHQALTEVAGLRSANADLRTRWTKAESDRAAAKDHLMRLQADFDNLRKRTDRERGDTHSRIVMELAHKLLPVIDNLDRAVKAESSYQDSESEEFRHFLGGVRLIFNQLNDVLEGFGIEAIPAVGEKFDPEVHEAVAAESGSAEAVDTITEELARGYRMGDKLLRPSMVKVSIRS